MELPIHAAEDLESDRFHQEVQLAEATASPGIDPAFVTTLAHEIRNILSPLNSSLQLLNLAGIDEASAAEARDVIGRQVRQLKCLVNDLLDAHRIEHRQISIRPCITEMSRALQEICNDHRPVFASQGIELALNLPTEPIWLKVDVGRLEQAMSNLLSNSLKFTDRGGSVRITLSAESANDQVVISVSDTGIGIEPAVMRSIFDPLAHDLSLRNGSGLGLGLPLVKRLIELHGGNLAVHSGGLGKGTEFRILLPRAS